MINYEFNTDDDLHTVFNYKKQVERSRGYKGLICVCINRLAEIHEFKCKAIVCLELKRLGIPFQYYGA